MGSHREDGASSPSQAPFTNLKKWLKYVDRAESGQFARA